MFSMPQWSVLQSLRERVFALSAREQSLLLLVLAVGFYFFLDALWITPQNLRLQALMDAQAATQAQHRAVSAELASVKPVNQEQMARFEWEHHQLKAQVALMAHIQTSIHSHAPALNSLVANILESEHPRVTLASLKTLPVKPLWVPASATRTDSIQAQRPGTYYRHGVEIEVRGHYLDLLAYVESLESQGQGVLWSDVRLTALKYPESALRLTLYRVTDQARWQLS